MVRIIDHDSYDLKYVEVPLNPVKQQQYPCNTIDTRSEILLLYFLAYFNSYFV